MERGFGICRIIAATCRESAINLRQSFNLGPVIDLREVQQERQSIYTTD